MNRRTLQKVIDAIKANKIEYAMGILDTLMESLPEEKSPIKTILENTLIKSIDNPQDEASILEAETKARLKNLDLSAIKND